MSTPIILTAAVENLGVQGDTVKVAEGYARNFLFPRGLAVPATPANLRRIDTLRKKHQAEMATRLEAAQAVAKQLAKQAYTITASAGADKKLFGSVTAADIATALQAKKIEVDRKQVLLERPIHELGAYEIEVKLHPEVIVKIQLTVVSSETAAGPAPGRRSARKDRE